MNKSKSKVKRVKGWAIISRIAHVLLEASEDKQLVKQEVQRINKLHGKLKVKVIPCTIEYTLPTQSKK